MIYKVFKSTLCSGLALSLCRQSDPGVGRGYDVRVANCWFYYERNRKRLILLPWRDGKWINILDTIQRQCVEILYFKVPFTSFISILFVLP